MRGLVFLVLWLVGLAAAAAEPCPGNPDALGTSRVLKISPGDFRRIGSMQYAQTLPLKNHEVVITRRRANTALHQRHSRYAGLTVRQSDLFPGWRDGAGLSLDRQAHLQCRPHNRDA